ncbi:unnamed protein product [Acanthoscelides obtectus]|uniref:Uncharacterized protein n=1 Tax=Acanthoscelides obtectus TaxID=200917 RepID=A0A9P0LZ59_ACAOB|nr:unnamed protein product [Acanthoscelides obtectus]CAK1667774.1 hypothetical protein AOBTE_LOCUS26031 [Acanthoscelides obtectus]
MQNQACFSVRERNCQGLITNCLFSSIRHLKIKGYLFAGMLRIFIFRTCRYKIFLSRDSNILPGNQNGYSWHVLSTFHK